MRVNPRLETRAMLLQAGLILVHAHANKEISRRSLVALPNALCELSRVARVRMESQGKIA